MNETEAVTFSYGHLGWPKEDDPRYASENEALKTAVDISQDRDFAIGVWNDETGELLHIVYEGAIFSR